MRANTPDVRAAGISTKPDLPLALSYLANDENRQMITSRRSLITGLIAFVAAPAIVRAASLMPVKVMAHGPDYFTWDTCWHIKDGIYQDGRWQAGTYIMITGIDMQADPKWRPLAELIPAN